MTFEEFEDSLSEEGAPSGTPPLLEALWHDRRGDWDQAHRIAQDVSSAEAAWVHAYLHRKEGDAGNAAYWYRRAARPVCRASLEAEWEEIARALLAAGG